MWRKRKTSEQLSLQEVVERAKQLGLIEGQPPTAEQLRDIEARRRVETLRTQIASTERELRERRLWMVALISALASAISALAAWAAVWYGK